MQKQIKNYSSIGTIFIVIILIWSCSDEFFMKSESSSDVGQSGSMARFTIASNYLYTVDRQNLRIFNISDAKQPEYKRKEMIGFDIETIFSRGDLLFIGAETAMYIYKLNDPEYPLQLTRYSHIYSCDPVVANDNYAFVTLSTSSTCGRWDNELHILDIQDPTDIEEIAIYQMNNPKGLGLKNNRLYLCDDGILKVYDITNLNEINLLQSIDNDAFDVIPMKNTLLAIGESGFYQYSYQANNTLVYLSKIEVSND